MQDAVERALDENPEMRAQMGEAASKRARAAAAKELGNDSFKARDFEEALRQYTAAIEADNTDPAFYSNRCASNVTQVVLNLQLYLVSARVVGDASCLA